MKVFSIILSIVSLISVSCNAPETSINGSDENNQQIQPAVLSVCVKANSSYTFNAYPYVRGIVFNNKSDTDTVITKMFFLDKPIFMVSGDFWMLPDGPVFRTYSLVLSPGDSVVLEQGVDKGLIMQYTSGFPNFVDSLISIPNSFFWPNVKAKHLGAVELKGMAGDIEKSYRANEAAIGQLGLTEARAKILRNLNTNFKYSGIANLLADSTVVISGVTDSLYDDLYEHREEIHSIDALRNQQIFETIIAYNANRRNETLDRTDLWASAAEVDPTFGETGIYKEALVSNIVYNFNRTPEMVKEINGKLRTVHMQDPFLDTLYRLTGILSKTFTDFNQAKNELKTFAGGRYSYIIDDDEKSADHEMKSIKGLAPVNLYDFAGKSSDLKNIVTSGNHELTFVDLWASWCIPCIGEMPALKIMEDKLKGKPILFIAISIDKEEDIDKWVSVSKENNIYDKPNQYRLSNFKESPLTKLINLRTIPRYLVIDNEGEILNDDFHRPSENHFEIELLKYLD